tara:strand:- start:264 stop:653 length:390 start_codon:yes stop_codon:yes gene_type:complete
MKGYCDVKKMKQPGHKFMANGGFTGSAMTDSVRISPHVRSPAKPKIGPVKPDFKRRATTPGGLAIGGTPKKTSTDAIVAAGTYAKGGKAPAMKHSDVAQDKALIRQELSKRGLKGGGLSPYSKKPVIGK